jgi:hypothetical protein
LLSYSLSFNEGMAIRFLLLCALSLPPFLLLTQPALPIRVATHEARFDPQGHLLPWISWTTALDREMHFYQRCPAGHGYPRFASVTFLNGDWTPQTDPNDTISATQDGLGIISYLKFYELRGKQDPAWGDP